MSAAVSEIFRTAREIIDRGIVRNGITSVGVAFTMSFWIGQKTCLPRMG